MMANAAGVAAPVEREFLPPVFIAVDERRFESEIKRIDTTLADERKNREKFETRIEKSVNDLRGEMNTRFDNMEKSVNARFDKIEKSVDARFDKMEKSVDARFDKIEKSVNARFEKVDSDIRDLRGEMFGLRGEMFTGFDKLNGKMDSHFRWMIGFLVGAVLIPIALQYFTK
ncbi:MAG: hypothetical protein LBR71_01205 [Synergistaceae bacterium]|nr:hypothetical protein [Synergistaceae bacterium]